MSCRCPPGAVLYWNSSMFALWPMRTMVIRSIDVVFATSTTLATKSPAGNGPKVSGATAPSTSSNHSTAWLRSGTVIPTWSMPTSPSWPGAMLAAACRAAAAGADAAAPSAAAPSARNSRRGIPVFSFTRPPPRLVARLSHVGGQLSLDVGPRPCVGEEIALRERVGRVDEHLRDARDPRAAADRRDDRRTARDRGLGDDAALEAGPDDRGVAHRVARAHQPARVQDGHARAEPGARRRPVEPTGRDYDGVPRHGADAFPWARDLDDADAGDLGVLRVHARKLLPCGDPDQLADARQLARLPRLEREAERPRV